MLTDQFRHSLDSKNRIIMPSKHREQLGSVFMITKGLDGCLNVYSMEEWQKYSEKLDALPKNKMAAVRRFIYANASEVTPDGQGRVGISQVLRDFAGIDKNIVIVGCGNYAEIWAEDKWDEQNSDDNLADIASLMDEFGL